MPTPLLPPPGGPPGPACAQGGWFLSTAAHELKTPIATIKVYVQLLERWAPGGHEPREGKAFQVLIWQCDRLNALVQELLEVSRLQLRRLALKP